MEADEEEGLPKQPTVEKSPKRMIGLLVISVLVLGAAVTGTFLGPRLLPHPGAASPSASAEATADTGEAANEAEPSNPQPFAAIVVDVRNKKGDMHHMRVGLTAELTDKVTKEEFERFQPRGREAAISFLRSKTFDELTEPAEFESITKQLSERMIHAIGEKRCNRVVVTDYVAQ
jgi:flagellar basal body-associated protein FliL